MLKKKKAKQPNRPPKNQQSKYLSMELVKAVEDIAPS